MPKGVKVTFEPHAEANLRKLARALIALALEAMEKEANTATAASEKEAS